jgi:hypothetical protein
MRMAGFALHRIAYSTGPIRGRLTRFIANSAHEARSSCTLLTCCRFYKGSLYLPLGRLLIRL